MGLQGIWRAAVKVAFDPEMYRLPAFGVERLDEASLAKLLLTLVQACIHADQLKGEGEDMHGGSAAAFELLGSAVEVAEDMLQSGQESQLAPHGEIVTFPSGMLLLQAFAQPLKLLVGAPCILGLLRLFVKYPAELPAEGLLRSICVAAEESGAMGLSRPGAVLSFVMEHSGLLQLSDSDLALVVSHAIAGGPEAGEEFDSRRYLEAQGQLLRKVSALSKSSQEAALSDQAAGALADLLQDDPSAAEQLLFPELAGSVLTELVFMAVEQQQPEALLQLLQHSIAAEQLQSLPLWVLQLAAESPLPETATAASVQMQLLGLLLQQGHQPPTTAVAALLQAVRNSPEQWQLFLDWLRLECRSAPPSAAARFLWQLVSLTSQEQQQDEEEEEEQEEEEQQRLSLAVSRKPFSQQELSDLALLLKRMQQPQQQPRQQGGQQQQEEQQQLLSPGGLWKGYQQQQQQQWQLSPDQSWQLYELLLSCQEGWEGEQQGLPATAADAFIQQQWQEAGVNGGWARRVLVVWEHFCCILPHAEPSANRIQQLDTRTQQLVLASLLAVGAYTEALEVVAEVPEQLGHLVAAWVQQQQQESKPQQQEDEGKQQQQQQFKPAMPVAGGDDVMFLHGVLKLAVAEGTQAAAATAAQVLELVLQQQGIGRAGELTDEEVNQLMRLLCKYQVISQTSAAAKLLPYAASPEVVAAYCETAAGCSLKDQGLLVKQLAGGVTGNLQGLLLDSLKLLLDKKVAKAVGFLSELHESEGLELQRSLSLAECDALMQAHVKQLQPPKDQLIAERVVHLWQHVQAESREKPAVQQLQGPSQQLLIWSFVSLGDHQQGLDLVHQVPHQLPQLAATWQQRAGDSIGAKLLQSALELAAREGNLAAVTAAEGFMELAKAQQLEDVVLDADLAVNVLQLYCKHPNADRMSAAARLLAYAASPEVVAAFCKGVAGCSPKQQELLVKQVAGIVRENLQGLMVDALKLLLDKKLSKAAGILSELHESNGVELQRSLSLADCNALMQAHVKQPLSNRLGGERVVYLWQHVQAASGKKLAVQQLQMASQQLLIRSFVSLGDHQQALDLVQHVPRQLPQLAAAWQQHARDSINAGLLQSALDLSTREGTLDAVAAAEDFMELAEAQQLQDAVLNADLAGKLLQLYCKHERVGNAARLLHRCSSAGAVRVFFTAAAQQDPHEQQFAVKNISSGTRGALGPLHQLLLGGFDLLLASKDAAAVGLLWEALQATKQVKTPLLPTLSKNQQQQVAELSCKLYSGGSHRCLAAPSFAPWCIAQEAALCSLSARTIAGLVTAAERIPGLVTAKVRDHEELQPCRAAVLLGVVNPDQLLKVADSSSSSHQLARVEEQEKATAEQTSECLASTEMIAKLVIGCLPVAAGSLDIEKVEEAVGWVDRSVTSKVLSPEAAAAALFAVWYSQQQQHSVRGGSVAAGVLGLSLYHAARKGDTLSAAAGWTSKPSLDSLVLDLALEAAAGARRWQEGRQFSRYHM